MTRMEAWLLVAAGAAFAFGAVSLWNSLQDIIESIEIIAERAEAPTVPGKIYHSAASTDARRPGKDAVEGGRHAAD